MEIERKFELSAFPEGLSEVERCTFYAGYLDVLPEIRIREKIKDGISTYKMCVKSKGTLSRVEIESDITKDFFEQLKDFIGKAFIEKEFRAYALPDGHKLECSRVDGGAFMYAEVEFESEDEANAFVAPDFLGRETTYERGRNMCEYWRQTRI